MTATVRRLVAAVAALALVGGAPALVGAQEGSGGKNVVLVTNSTDGRTAGRSGVAMGRAAGPAAVPENLASATSSCTDCRTIAIAIQAVVVTSDPDIASPRNAAVAVNSGCTRCETYAYAWQYVKTTGGPVAISPDGEAMVNRVRSEARELASSRLPFDQLTAELDALVQDMRRVVDEEAQRVGGGEGRVGRSVKSELPKC